MSTLDPAAVRRRGPRLGAALFDPLGGGRVDYLSPAGDPGFFGPGSMAWKAHANAVALAVGGVAAVILELAEPRVRTGVWEHSIFRTDPLTRMRRTGEATMITTFGPTAAAQARVDMVTRMHARVSGATPEGDRFQALDPELMTWVHITAGWGFLNAYRAYVEPGLSRPDQDRYYAEGGRLGAAFGAADTPSTVAEVEAWFDRMRPKLAPHPIIHDFLQIVARTSPLGIAGRALQPLVVQAAIDLLPKDLVTRLNLPVDPLKLAAARPVLRGLAAAASLAPPQLVRDAHARMAGVR